MDAQARNWGGSYIGIGTWHVRSEMDVIWNETIVKSIKKAAIQSEGMLSWLGFHREVGMSSDAAAKHKRRVKNIQKQERTSSARQVSTLIMINPPSDVWREIGDHLEPLHWSKCAQVNRNAESALNPRFWYDFTYCTSWESECFEPFARFLGWSQRAQNYIRRVKFTTSLEESRDFGWPILDACTLSRVLAHLPHVEYIALDKCNWAECVYRVAIDNNDPYLPQDIHHSCPVRVTNTTVHTLWVENLRPYWGEDPYEILQYFGVLHTLGIRCIQ